VEIRRYDVNAAHLHNIDRFISESIRRHHPQKRALLVGLMAILPFYPQFNDPSAYLERSFISSRHLQLIQIRRNAVQRL